MAGPASQAEASATAQKETIAAALGIAVEDVDLENVPSQNQVVNATGNRSHITVNA